MNEELNELTVEDGLDNLMAENNELTQALEEEQKKRAEAEAFIEKRLSPSKESPRDKARQIIFDAELPSLGQELRKLSGPKAQEVWKNPEFQENLRAAGRELIEEEAKRSRESLVQYVAEVGGALKTKRLDKANFLSEAIRRQEEDKKKRDAKPVIGANIYPHVQKYAKSKPKFVAIKNQYR